MEHDDARTDAKLLALCRCGKREGFDALWRRYEGYFRRQAARWIDATDRDDLLQDLSLHLWQILQKQKEPVRFFKSWACTVMHRKAIDRQRREATPGRDVTQLPPGVEPVDPASRPEKGREESLAAVRECVASLSPDLREVVVLRFFDDLGVVAVGEKLSINKSNVTRRVQTALTKLKTCMEKKLGVRR